MKDPTSPARIGTTHVAGAPQPIGAEQVSIDEHSRPDQLSALENYNNFLSRELSSIELERDVLLGDLRKIKQSFGWKLIERYRKWLDGMRWRHSRIADPFERMASWGLGRLTGTPSLSDAQRYQIWVTAHCLTSDRIRRINAEIAVLAYKPLITIILEIDGNVVARWLEESLKSIAAQLYTHWELLLVTREQPAGAVAAQLRALVEADRRIHFEQLPQLAVTHGDYIAFTDQHGELESDALFEVVKWLNRKGIADLFFSDEDKLDADGRRSDPFFKPGWNPDLLLSMNYFGPFMVLSRNLIENLDGPLLDRDHRYDLGLRAVERTGKIVHLQKVLFHGRNALASDDLGAVAISQALLRRGTQGSVDVTRPGCYSVRYAIRGNPLVSILIPTKDKCHLLQRCLNSIDRLTEYKNYEIAVLDNGSTDPQTLGYLGSLSNKIRVLRYPQPFNFSLINNLGVRETRGDFLLFLNNDTEVIRPDWMTAMLEHAQRPQVGAVGAKLLFEDGRIQHAGVVIGIGGLAGHSFRLKPHEPPSHMRLEETIRDCSAVTAACMMMRRSVFDELGGFCEELAMEFNDVDLCLRLRQLGYLVLYAPRALLYHHESASRGRQRSPHDAALFRQRWRNYIEAGDPYYNSNLTLERDDWSVSI
jgi:O-antigen biosynthesis protein